MITKQDYLLTCLSEECAEVIQNVSKIIRFGLEDYSPKDTAKVPNINKTVAELNDILGIIELLKESDPRFYNVGDLDAIEKKKAKVLKYMEYSKKAGRL